MKSDETATYLKTKKLVHVYYMLVVTLYPIYQVMRMLVGFVHGARYRLSFLFDLLGLSELEGNTIHRLIHSHELWGAVAAIILALWVMGFILVVLYFLLVYPNIKAAKAYALYVEGHKEQARQERLKAVVACIIGLILVLGRWP